MDDLVAVTCLRHGLTEKNKKKAYIGWMNAPLSAEGKQRLRKGLASYPAADAVISSDLARCLESAALIYPHQPKTIDRGFREMSFGDWEGKTYEELKDLDVYRAWLENPLQTNPPNGERYSVFKCRVIESWKFAVKAFNDTQIKHLVIISHGGPVRVLLESFAPESKPFWEWKVEPGAGYNLFGIRRQIVEGKRCTSLQAVPIMANANG
ncbi:alpha-ribazole phosphatase [Scopulibacillus darangshiensis]|uniref:Alpha-ribazole phosphatase n=1 Tax=Scopulibacillus darangshiensis TaxID=442528 RepID=A0A4R2PA65_9BACL|nr:histidine phosphatase family protein [Scopulibacillus darangshiensis]TCP31258.1 alpha-ribazole phosphatase [Scopulibacillus darangshiensis]